MKHLKNMTGGNNMARRISHTSKKVYELWWKYDGKKKKYDGDLHVDSLAEAKKLLKENGLDPKEYMFKEVK